MISERFLTYIESNTTDKAQKSSKDILKIVHVISVALGQGSSNLPLEGQSAAEFSSNPDQTHLPVISNDLEDSD